MIGSAEYFMQQVTEQIFSDHCYGILVWFTVSAGDICFERKKKRKERERKEMNDKGRKEEFV